MKDEVLKKLNNTDSEIIPRYDIILPTGEIIYSGVQIVLKNEVLEPGTPLNKQNLLSDDTSVALGLDPTTSTPDEAFRTLKKLLSGFCPKVNVVFTAGGTVYIRNETTLETVSCPVPTSGPYAGVATVDLYEYGTYSVWGMYNDVKTQYSEPLLVDAVKIYDIRII